MQIILLENIQKLGERYDVVEVKPGFGRNFLLPAKKAMVASKANLAKINSIKQRVAKKEAQELALIMDLVNQVKAAPIKVGAKVGTTGKIFGSVTNVQLADAIKKLSGVELDRRKINILDEVKTLGTYSAEIDFHSKVKETIEFEVIGD